MWQAALATSILFDMAWFGPIRGSRNQEFTLLLTAYFLFTSGGGARSAKLTTSALMVAGVLTMLIWGAERGTKPVAQMSSGGADLVGEVAGALYAPFDILNKIIWAVPGELPYLKGASLIEAATIWIPRTCWAGKPRGLGWDLNDIYYGTIRGGNSVPTWPGELYWDFGIIGVIAGMFMMGVVCARLARLNRPYIVERGFPVTRTLYAVSYPIFLVWVWAGSSEAMWYLLEDILPVYVACRIAMRQVSIGCTRSLLSSGVTALTEQDNNTRI
jgi:oligosaccharide repeat unit polymerase